MSPSELIAKVKKQQGGLLLDTNVLLLYLIEVTKPNAYGDWKWTRQFTREHVEVLGLAVATTKRLITTPHVLAEASNLSEKLPPSIREGYFSAFAEFVRGVHERFPRGRELVEDEAFSFLGIADLAQVLLPRVRRPLIVTVDALLTVELEKRGLPVVNLNHCIEGWTTD